MKKIILTIFYCLIASTLLSQVTDEIEVIRNSSLDSAMKVRYEYDMLARHMQAMIRNSKSHSNKKSTKVLTTVSKTVTVTAGGLKSALGSELTTVTNLLVNGTIDARDFKTMRDEMSSLSVLDLSTVIIAAYTGTAGTAEGTISTTYSANAIPVKAFYNGTHKLTSITLPTSINSIGFYAFTCYYLTSISIPSMVSSIEHGAFLGSSLKEITVSTANTNYSSENGILFNKNKTILLRCPKSKIGSYSIPPSVTTIDNLAFFDSNLTSVIIPYSVTSIVHQAFNFSNCVILVDAANTNFASEDSLLFNKDKTTLIQCPKRRQGSLIVPLSVSSIEFGAFTNCYQITSISIPASVKSISGMAFWGCSGLTSFYAYPTVPITISSSSDIFHYVDKTKCTLYIPSGSRSAYQAANEWKDFTTIKEMSSNTLNVSSNTVSLDYLANSSRSVTITSNTSWTVSCDQTWLTVTPTSGSGNDSIILTAQANNGDVRNATVTVSATGISPQTITVTQAKNSNFTPTLSISTNTVSLDYTANSSGSVTVNSNTSWSASSNQAWLTVSPTNKTGNGTLVLTAQANLGDKRTATITISAIGLQSQIITVTQSENLILLESLKTPPAGCEKSSLALSYSIISGLPTHYKIIFGNTALAAGFQNINYTNLPSTSPNGTIIFNTPSGITGNFTASLQLKNATSGKESTIYPFSFSVNLSSDYIISKFNEIVLCDNSSGRFTAYQWYKNGTAIEGATRQFYKDLLGLNGSYSLKVKTTDGKELFTCPKTFMAIRSDSREVSIYPNPVKKGGVFTIELKNNKDEDLNGATMVIYNLSGISVFKTNKVSPIIPITVPFTEGYYFGHLITAYGKDYSFKFLVSK